jgi:teichoic acid transport system permease protein
MYGSCMFFSIDRFDNLPAIKSIMEYNPLYIILHLSRESLLYGQIGQWRPWAILGLWSLSAVVVGMLFFWKGEESYGREI